MATTEVFFKDLNSLQKDVIPAVLSQIGFYSFWDEDNGFRAYVLSENFDKTKLDNALSDFSLNIQYSVQETSPEIWDLAQSDSFDPVLIQQKIWLGSLSDQPDKHVPYILHIDPKMAFGSGSHPSTLLCLELMLEIDFTDKHVVDAGTGTAVLAVLAAKMGARRIHAFDNNPWAIEVAKNTLIHNQVHNVDLLQCGVDDVRQSFDIVLANLNYSVFEQYFDSVLSLARNHNGIMILSGIMSKNKNDILNKAKNASLNIQRCIERYGWCAFVFERKN